MAILAVVRDFDDVQVSAIMAELTDPCPDGHHFVELPPDHVYLKGKIVHYANVSGGLKQVQEF
jgi:hypothetical protein